MIETMVYTSTKSWW